MTNKMMEMVNKMMVVATPIAKKAAEAAVKAADAGMKTAKAEFNKRYQTTDEAVKDMLLEEIKKYDFYGYKVVVEERPASADAHNANCGSNPLGGICGLTDPTGKRVMFYYSSLKGVMNTLFFLNWRKMVKNVVRHENRHCQQFTYLRTHGGEDAVGRAMLNEAFSIYGLSPLERDAMDYQSGKENDLSKVCSQFLR